MNGITVGYRIGPREFTDMFEAERYGKTNDFTMMTEVAYRDGQEVSTFTFDISSED